MMSNEIVERALLAVGAAVVVFYMIKYTYEMIQAFRLYFWSQYFFKGNFIKRYGKWAVISGATDGIGLEMARFLAQRGHSIVVIGRNETKLANTKKSLEKLPNAGEIVTIKIDLSDSSLENFESIREELDPENRDIGILINNAGYLVDKVAHFHRSEMAALRTIVNVNVLAPTYLARMIIPGMLERGRGLVMNNSSILGGAPGNHIQCYSATKAYIDSLSRQLAIEYHPFPIDIINLTPGPVLTSMYVTKHGLESSRCFPTPDVFVRSAMNAMSTRIWTYCGTIEHELLLKMCQIRLPIWLHSAMRHITFSQWGVDDSSLTPVTKRRRMNRTT